MMGKKDERVEMCSEVLQGIRTLKMHVWEEHFLSKILRKENTKKYIFNNIDLYLDNLVSYLYCCRY